MKMYSLICHVNFGKDFTQKPGNNCSVGQYVKRNSVFTKMKHIDLRMEPYL